METERARFVLKAELSDLSFAQFCRRHCISRSTGYKWLGRYRHEGPLTASPTGPDDLTRVLTRPRSRWPSASWRSGSIAAGELARSAGKPCPQHTLLTVFRAFVDGEE